MNKWAKKSLVAVAVASTLGIASGAAQADVLAESILLINSLTFNNHSAGTGAGAILVNGTNVTVLSNQNQGQITGSLTGFAPFDSTVLTGTPLNIPVGCLGPAGACAPAEARLADNAFGIFSFGLGDPLRNTAAADQDEIGAPIDGVTVGSSPAKIRNSSLAQLNAGAASAAGGSQNNLNAQFVFTVDTDGIVDIVMNVSAYLEAFSTPGAGGTANAALSNSFSLTDNSVTDAQHPFGTEIFTWAPNGGAGGITGGTEVLDPFNLNASVAASGPVGGLNFRGSALGAFATGTFEAETPILIAGHIYTIGADNKTSASANLPAAVPEPGVLLMVATGLLGLWGVRRRSLDS